MPPMPQFLPSPRAIHDTVGLVGGENTDPHGTKYLLRNFQSEDEYSMDE